MIRPSRLFGFVFYAALLVFWPARAAAQGFVGLGPRVSFVRGDNTTATPSTQLFGGVIHLKASKRVALEGSIDFRSSTSTDGTQKVTETPLQGTVLIYLVRTTISPYLLAGYGVYTEKTETFATTGGMATSTSTTHNTGWHAGFGGEILVGKRVGLFADYRYRFVQLGNSAGANATPLIPGVNLLKISHNGSMWTGGFIVYF
jgi:opacity protein-like surface antigen